MALRKYRLTNKAERTRESSKSIIQRGWVTSRFRMVLRILGVVPKIGEKEWRLKVGEKAALHLNPLHVPGDWLDYLWLKY